MSHITDDGDEILEFMLGVQLIQTRVNRTSKEQEFALTEFGWGVMKMLKFFNGEEDEEEV
jgi:hypothetical protein